MLHLSTKHLNNDDLARLQAPSQKGFLSVPSLPGVPSNIQNEQVSCSSCGVDFAEGVRFCRHCGLAKPSQAALVSVRNEVPRSDFRRNVSFGPTSVSDLSSQVLPNAPPRLIARLQELELDSLLALCERLEGRLSKPRRSNRIKASDAELDDLCESLVDPEAMPSPQVRQQQQQLRYLTQLREAKAKQELQAAEGLPLPPTSTSKPILKSADARNLASQAPTPSPSPSTQVPSTSASPEPDGQISMSPSKQEAGTFYILLPLLRWNPNALTQHLRCCAACVAVQVLDALLVELNDLLEKAPSKVPIQTEGTAASIGAGAGAQAPPKPSPTPGNAGVIANSAGPLPVEALAKPVKPSAAFIDTVGMLQDGLRNLVERFSDEVAQATAELKTENEGLLEELAKLRARVREPSAVLSTECQTEEAEPYEAVEACALEVEPTPMATRMQPDLAVRFQSEEQRIDIPGVGEQPPLCPDVDPPDADAAEGSNNATFAARIQWVQERAA